MTYRRVFGVYKIGVFLWYVFEVIYYCCHCPTTTTLSLSLFLSLLLFWYRSIRSYITTNTSSLLMMMDLVVTAKLSLLLFLPLLLLNQYYSSSSFSHSPISCSPTTITTTVTTTVNTSRRLGVSWGWLMVDGGQAMEGIFLQYSNLKSSQTLIMITPLISELYEIKQVIIILYQ